MTTNYADRYFDKNATPSPSPDPDGESVEESDGRFSRNQVFAMLLVEDDGSAWIIPYMSLLAGNAGRYRGNEFAFRFTDGDLRYEAVLKGNPKALLGFQGVIDKLVAGKRDCIRPGGQYVTGVTVRQIVD